MNESTPTDSDSQDTPITQSAEAKDNGATKPRKRKPWTAILAGLLLLVLGGAGAGGYYIWQHVIKRLDTLGTDIASLRMRNAELRDDIEPRFASLEGNTSAQRLEAQLTEQKAQVSQRFAEQIKQNAVLQEAVSALHDMTMRDQQGWVIAEVEYLMNIAHHRLKLMRDLDGAAQALEGADERLSDLGDPLLQPVREQLAQEVYALKNFERPDLTGVALELEQLIAHLQPLPLRGSDGAQTTAQTPTEAPREETAGGWQGVVQAVSAELNRHITLRRKNHAPAEPADADPQASMNNFETLREKLEAARQAALVADDGQYHRQLGAALEQIDANLDPAAAATLKAELEALDKIDFKPELPNIDESLALLRAAQRPRPDEEGN